MRTEFFEEHWLDGEGKPAGGVTTGTGFTISWQNGPLGRGDDRKEPNGAFVENIIDAAAGRLKAYQSTQFRCAENQEAIALLELALEHLNNRTARREAAGTEGTHDGS